MDLQRALLIILFCILGVLIWNSPSPEWPSSLSVTIVSTPESGKHAVVSFLTDGDGARIVEPFHWDLIEDIPLDGKRVYSVIMEPALFNRLLEAPVVVVESYHGIGNWSSQRFLEKKFSTWMVRRVSGIGRHVDVEMEITGDSNSHDLLMWTSVGETRVTVPGGQRSPWIERPDPFYGGYWPVRLHRPLSGIVRIGYDLPLEIIGTGQEGLLQEQLTKKTDRFNMVSLQEGVMTVTTVEASLEDIKEGLLGEH